MRKFLLAAFILTTGLCCWCALAPGHRSPVRMISSMIINDSIPDIRYQRDTTLTPERYAKLQQRISLDRTKLGLQSKDSVNRYFHQTLYQKMIPYWLGTTWDFNGYTAIPGEGTVACGYFVTTTLRHMGLNLNRYKLAQQYSHSIVKSLCQHDTVFASEEKMFAHLRSKPDDVWVVGLDNHVGFLFKSGNQIRFVHSTYVDPGCVCDERAESSTVLAGSNAYVVGSLLHNNDLMKKWLAGQAVMIRE